MAARAYLHPGEWQLFTTPTEVEMVLGSCVAVCLWRADLAASAVCHAVLPFRYPGTAGPPSARYVDEAVALMLARLAAVAGEVPLLAGIAGGCWSVVAGDVARRNRDVARRVLAQRNLPLCFDDTGGNGYRKFWFDTVTCVHRCPLQRPTPAPGKR